MSGHIERPVKMTRAEAISLIGSFLHKEWRQLKESDVSITRCQAGISNEVYFVTRATPSVQEPSKVVVRKCNDAQDDPDGLWTGFGMMLADRTEQIVIQMELSRQALGPKQLGLMMDGRIEEWIDCRPLKHADAINPLIEQDIAISMARVHALDLPFKKPGFHFLDVLRFMYTDLEPHLHFFDDHEPELRPAARYDYKDLFAFMDPLMSFAQHRMVLMNWDMHYGNMTVLNDPKPDQLKVMLFDFEVASYNIRGKDLGNFLLSRSGFVASDRGDKQLQSNEEFYPFLRAYLDESAKLFADIDRNGKDSLDHVMIEALLGGIVALLYYLFFQLKVNSVDRGKTPVLQTYASAAPGYFDGILACRHALETRFQDLQGILNK